MRWGSFGLLVWLPVVAFAQPQPPPTQVFAVVDARENVLSNQVPPTRTGTRYSTFGVPDPSYDYGRDTQVATGLAGLVRFYFWSTFKLLGESVPTEPSRDPRAAMLAVAPKQAGARPGLVFVITEWWEDGYNQRTCRKAMTAYAVGPGGAVLAQSSAADHECLLTFGKSEKQQRDELFSALLTTPSMTAALNGRLAAPPVSAPPPPPPPGAAPAPAAPAAAPSGCSAAQVAKLKGYGLSDDDLRRTCTPK